MNQTTHLPSTVSKADILGVGLWGLAQEPFRAEHPGVWIYGIVLEDRPVCALMVQVRMRG